MLIKDLYQFMNHAEFQYIIFSKSDKPEIRALADKYKHFFDNDATTYNIEQLEKLVKENIKYEDKS